MPNGYGTSTLPHDVTQLGIPIGVATSLGLPATADPLVSRASPEFDVSSGLVGLKAAIEPLVKMNTTAAAKIVIRDIAMDGWTNGWVESNPFACSYEEKAGRLPYR